MIEIQVEQDIEIQFYDLSLVFGETFTIQPGLSYTDGKSSSQFYGVQKEQHSNSNTATYEVEFSGEGYAYFVNFGVDLWGIELIAGYRKEFLKFPKIDNTGSEIDSEEVFKITSYNNIGIGYSF